jgi:hypothetical protein
LNSASEASTLRQIAILVRFASLLFAKVREMREFNERWAEVGRADLAAHLTQYRLLVKRD